MACGLAGCPAGPLTWLGGHEVLRTAFARVVVDGPVTRAEILLSNGAFECELPGPELGRGPNRSGVDRFLAAACRQGATHLLLNLWTTRRQTWRGSYPTTDEPWARSLDARPVATATWSVVHEGEVRSGLTGDIPTVKRAIDRTLSDGGFVDVTSDRNGLRGEFSFSEAISGSFNARWCHGGELMSVMASVGPLGLCPGRGLTHVIVGPVP